MAKRTEPRTATVSLVVRVQVDTADGEYRDAHRTLGPGRGPIHVVGSEILSNLNSVGYVRWARVDRLSRRDGR